MELEIFHMLMSPFIIDFSNTPLIPASIYTFLAMVLCSGLEEGWIAPSGHLLGKDQRWGRFSACIQDLKTCFIVCLVFSPQYSINQYL